MDIIKVKNKYKKKVDKFKERVKINASNIDKEIIELSSSMNNTGLSFGEAIAIKEMAEKQLKQARAKAILKWSKKKNKGKPLNIPQVQANVELDSAVNEAEDFLIEANYVYNICKSATTSMKEKGQQLTNIANNKRAEVKGNIRRKK
jgi:hypothetical protein